MGVNIGETRKKIEDRCMCMSRIGKKIGMHRVMVSQILTGKYPAPNSKAAKKLYNKLDELGVLVCDE